MRILLAVISCGVLLVVLSACSPSFTLRSPSAASQRETLVQISTIDALMNGVYDGIVDFKTLRRYGDFGIGTFEALDGEMLGFGGRFFQVRADGIAYPISDSIQTPFASLTFFDEDILQQVPQGTDYQDLQAFLDGILPTVNIFHAVKIVGSFSSVQTRSVPGQAKPYPPLVEVTKNQPTFEFSEVEGTIVGFRCPDYVRGVNVPGYHLHFLTENENAGGHLLKFRVRQAVACIDNISEFLMILPGEKNDFYTIDLSRDLQEELQEVEK